MQCICCGACSLYHGKPQLGNESMIVGVLLVAAVSTGVTTHQQSEGNAAPPTTSNNRTPAQIAYPG